jgi:DNA repair exonuclease SbcCD ATPase subunit
MDKKEVLDKLSNMSVDQIDKLKDEKLVEYRTALHEYHQAKDDEMVKRHEKRKELLKENSHSKAEMLLRSDEELFQLKRKVAGLKDLKDQIKLAIEILTNYYWKNKT